MVVQQKLTQHCKETISQIKNRILATKKKKKKTGFSVGFYFISLIIFHGSIAVLFIVLGIDFIH